MKTKFLIAAALAATVLASCGKEAETPKKRLSFATSETGTVASSEGTVAVVRGKNVADLSFKAPGRVSSLSVNVGDRVEKGQLLATVDNREAEISAAGYAGSAGDLDAVTAAVLAIGDSTRALAESRAQVSAADVKTAETGKTLAARDLELAKKNLENSRLTLSGSALSAAERVTAAEQSLSLAKTQLDNTTSLLSEQESSLRSSALASLAGAFVTARSGRDFADGIIGVTEENRHKNDAFENYLGAKDSSTMSRADTAFRAFNGSYEETYAWYYANVAGKTDVSFDVAKEALSRASKTLVLEREALHALKSVLEKTVESTYLDVSAISTYEQKTDSLLSNLESSILSPNGGGVDGVKSAIASFEKNRELQLSSLRDAVKLAETSLELAKSGKTVSGSDDKRNLDALEIAVRVKEDGVAIAEQNYQKALAGAEAAQREMDAKVKESEAQASEARAKKREVETGLALSSERAGYSEIRAPFSGIVTEKYADVGATVASGMPVLQVSDTENPKVEFSFDSSVSGLSVGSAVPLESVKTGEAFTGTVLVLAESDSFETSKRKAEVSVPKNAAAIGDRVRIKVSGA